MSTFEIVSSIDEKQYKSDLMINPVELDNMFINQAALSGHYGILHARAQRQASVAKLRLETIQSQVSRELREQMVMDGSKRVTDKTIEADVHLDARVVRAKMHLTNALYEQEIAKSAVFAFQQRRDMLVQISKQDIEERKANMTGGTTTDITATLQRAAGMVNQ